MPITRYALSVPSRGTQQKNRKPEICSGQIRNSELYVRIQQWAVDSKQATALGQGFNFTSLKAGSTCAVSARCSTTRSPCPIRHAIKCSAVASQDHQRRAIRRRRNETRTLRLRSSRATTKPRFGIFHHGLIVGAHKSNCSADKTVFVHDISLDTSAILASLPAQKKVRPRISPRPDPIGTGYIRPCLQFVHSVTLIAAVNEWPLQPSVAGWSMRHRQASTR